MVVIRAEFSGRVAAAMKDRAADQGFSSIAAYLRQLIDEDLKKWGGAKRRGYKSLKKMLGDTKVSHEVVSRAMGVWQGKEKTQRETLSAVRKRLLDTMFSYMKASEDPGYGYACGYQLTHIDRCAAIIDDYIEELSGRRKRKQEEILNVVKKVVVKLNRLNVSCGRALIETDQRENLCRLILMVAQKAGLDTEEDVTERWRGW
jgi:hypothetical protein